MGPGAILPLLFGGLSTGGGVLASLAGLNRLQKLGQQATGDVLKYSPDTPGAGWSGAGSDYISSEMQGDERLNFINSMDEWYRSDPARATAYLHTLDKTKEAQEYQQGAAQRNIDLYKNSALPQIQDNLSQLREEVAARARERADNPNVITQAEMDAIIGRAVGNTNQAYASQGAMANEAVGRRGLSRDAAAGIQQQLQAANRQEQLAKIADVAQMNAMGRTQNQQNAEALLASLANMDQLLAGINTQYTGDLANANLLEASLHQPLPVNVLGDAASQRAITQALLESGAASDVANMLFNTGSGMFGLYDSAMTRNLQEQMMPSDWERFWGGGGGNLLGTGLTLGYMDYLNAFG